jgi:hypothetical protein
VITVETTAVICPYCRASVTNGNFCRHLRWTPARGGPIEFARWVVANNPYTARRALSARRIPSEWWEREFDWLMGRLRLRLHVADGYCFSELVDLDLLCMDIWHHFEPATARAR